MVAIAERKLVLDGLARMALGDVVSLWRNASILDNSTFRDVIVRGVPEVITPHIYSAGEFGADWYNQSAPELSFRAVNYAEVDTGAIEGSTRWALGASGEAALDRLGGVVLRQVFGGQRETTKRNAQREAGSKWVRSASANACKFCAMLATRTEEAYSSKAAAKYVGSGIGGRIRGNQAKGDKYHDNCRCMPVEIRPGKSREMPSYYGKWQEDYKEARKNASGGSLQEIMAAWPK